MGEDGQVRYSESILFTNCTVTGNGKWAAIYDVGGREALWTDLYVLTYPQASRSVCGSDWRTNPILL